MGKGSREERPGSTGQGRAEEAKNGGCVASKNRRCRASPLGESKGGGEKCAAGQQGLLPNENLEVALSRHQFSLPSENFHRQWICEYLGFGSREAPRNSCTWTRVRYWVCMMLKFVASKLARLVLRRPDSASRRSHKLASRWFSPRKKTYPEVAINRARHQADNIALRHYPLIDWFWRFDR